MCGEGLAKRRVYMGSSSKIVLFMGRCFACSNCAQCPSEITAINAGRIARNWLRALKAQPRVVCMWVPCGDTSVYRVMWRAQLCKWSDVKK